MTMALWSAPRTGTTWKPFATTPRTKAWSIRISRGADGQGPQVGKVRPPASRATTTAASVNWEVIRLYRGQPGVALKSPTNTLAGPFAGGFARKRSPFWGNRADGPESPGATGAPCPSLVSLALLLWILLEFATKGP